VLLPVATVERAMTPAELREQSRLSRQAALDETTREIKLRLASHALALAQLAERIERQASDRKFETL
jgi:hypothetical protein